MKKNYNYFILYKNDDYKIKLLCLMLLQTSASEQSYDDETKWMHFLNEDGELLKKYNNIWDKVSNLIKKGSDSKPFYTKKYLKAKMKSYKDETKSNFHDKEILKEGFHYIFINDINWFCS